MVVAYRKIWMSGITFRVDRSARTACKKRKMKCKQDFNPMWHSTFAHQGAPKTHSNPHTPTAFSKRNISGLKKRLLSIMMMQDPRKRALLPQ